MTIGEGIARGGSVYLDRQEKARQFDASLREKAREADQQAAVSLANHPRDTTQERLSEQAREFDASLAEKQRQFDVSNKWNDALRQQQINTMKARENEEKARYAYYQQLEEQSRQAAADLKNERTNTMKGLYWLSRRNGGMTVSPEVLSDFTKNMKAPDLVAIKTAGFFYNEDGTIKSPQNDDNKDAMFGISYNYIDPQTGKIALTPDGKGYAEKVLVPRFQKDWYAEGDIFSPDQVGSSYGRRYGRGGQTFDQQMALIEHRAKMKAEYGNGSGSSGGCSSKFNNDQFVAIDNEMRTTESALNDLDKRSPDYKKRVEELSSYYDELAAKRKRLLFKNLEDDSVPHQGGVVLGQKPAPTGDDVLSKLEGGKTVQGGERKDPFGGAGNNGRKKDEDSPHSPSQTPKPENVTQGDDVKSGDESEYTFSDQKTESDYNEWKKRNERTKFGIINHEFINLPEVKKRKMYEDYGWEIDDSSLFEWLGGRRGHKTKPSFDKKK